MSLSDRTTGFTSRSAFEHFKGRNRQYGNAVCPECKQSFVNSARLERHLAVHQVFGAYLCPLCGKTYKYEYNLFFHWRKTCQYLNELVNVDQRKANIEPGSELFLSDMELKEMVLNLLMRLRRVARQPPLRPIHPNRSMEEPNSLPRRVEEAHDPYNNTNREVDDGKGPSTSSGDDDKAVVFMDDYVNPADTVVDINGELVNVVSADRGKWNIPEDGKPLECPDCFRFKYDYNLLFHYRHSCAYTKLLVGADVRKLLDAASLRKLVSHIKQTDPELRPGSSRLINIKRRPSIKAVPRNILPLSKNSEKAKLKRGSEEWKKCPVCGVMFFGQKSLDKHVGTVHLLCQNFLDKAITRDSTFKYDYNLLFHYRHSCAYTKLLVGADVRKLLDAASLRKLVSHIKQTDPELRPGVKEDKDVVDEQGYTYHGDDDRGEEGVEYAEDDDLGEYVNEDNAEIIDYHSSQLVEYEIDGAEAGQGERRLVRIVDGRGQQLLHYLNDEDVPCDAFVQYVEDDNGQQIVEYIDGEDGEHIVQYISADNMTGDEVMAYMKPQAPSASNVKEEKNFNANTNDARKSADQYPQLHTVSSSASSNMPEDFMQEE
ncbi:zinc finger, C2H2 type [Ancylostoma ceylanicum]|uniref:Zinc finger, C2H2 type n=1 Tax=Ancylostoma ceylanicum TaxID=53326 RepID=A0A0D6L529_9BILA|nr:zinc finger, C2H2 type [Ancylostoma ceylanicum]